MKDAAVRRHGELNLVACKDGILRHWYEAFPRDYEVIFAGIEPPGAGEGRE